MSEYIHLLPRSNNLDMGAFQRFWGKIKIVLINYFQYFFVEQSCPYVACLYCWDNPIFLNILFLTTRNLLKQKLKKQIWIHDPSQNYFSTEMSYWLAITFKSFTFYKNYAVGIANLPPVFFCFVFYNNTKWYRETST